MRMVVVVLLLAGVLVLALAVPALADSAKLYGVGHRDGNWSGNPPPPQDIPPGQSEPYPTPGHRQLYVWENPVTGDTTTIMGNPGQWTSLVVQVINDGWIDGVENFGQFTQMGLDMVRSLN